MFEVGLTLFFISLIKSEYSFGIMIFEYIFFVVQTGVFTKPLTGKKFKMIRKKKIPLINNNIAVFLIRLFTINKEVVITIEYKRTYARSNLLQKLANITNPGIWPNNKKKLLRKPILTVKKKSEDKNVTINIANNFL